MSTAESRNDAFAAGFKLGRSLYLPPEKLPLSDDHAMRRIEDEVERVAARYSTILVGHFYDGFDSGWESCAREPA